MKNFGKILVCLILCVFTIGLVGCKDRPDPFFQSKATNAIGNGGLAVESNGYLYFVNGYQAASEQKKQNASYFVGSLKVAKLSNGNVVTNNEGYLNDDYLRTISDKLCGFEATGLYVFGDYLYFTAPCQENEKGGDWVKERVDFYRIKLNKTSDVERIYQSKVNFDSLTYQYYYDGKTVSLVVCEKADEVSIYNIEASNSKYPVTTVCEKVLESNYYLGANNDYQNNNHKYGYVFYLTQTENETDYKYVLYNPIKGTKTEKSYQTACKIQYVSDKFIYYTVENEGWHELKTFAISEDAFAPSLLTYAYNGEVSFDVTMDDYVLSVGEDNITLIANQVNNINKRILVSGESEIKILGYTNGSVIYYNGSDIKLVSYTTNSEAVVLTNLESLKKVYTNVTSLEMEYNSVSGNNVYFYATITNKDNETNTYLYSVDLSGKVQVISIYEEDDVPEVEEEEL